MLISDISVRRPVLAAVISLVLLILGLLAGSTLSVREYPDIQPPVVSIDTRYTGASGDVVERRITQVLEDEVSGLEGVVKMTSRSQDERSTITMEFTLDRDIDGAANDVRERVSRVLRALPEEADPPQITKQDKHQGRHHVRGRVQRHPLRNGDDRLRRAQPRGPSQRHGRRGIHPCERQSPSRHAHLAGPGCLGIARPHRAGC